MPVKLPGKHPTDPRLLALLIRISENDGKLLIDEGDYEHLEEENYFRDAEARRLISIDQGGEWSTGAVIAITRQGRTLIGEKEPDSLWRKLEILLRGRIGGTDI